MVKISLCSLLLLASCIQLPCQALNPDGTAPVQRLQPEFGIIDQSQNSALSRIYKIEAAFFGRPYEKENLNQRVNRLENNVFGSVSYDALNDRLTRLERSLGREPQLKIENPRAPKQIAKVQPQAKVTPDKKFADFLNSAQADISLKRFHAAAEELMNAIQINPSSSLAFRQLGDVLVELKDRDGAIESYKACFENDPFGENGKYAKTKLLSLSASNARSKTAPQDTQPVVENTINTVNRQVRDYRTRVQNEGMRISARIARESAYRFNRDNMPAYGLNNADYYLRRAQRGLGGAGLGGGGGRGGRNGFAYPGEISDLNYMRSNWARTDSRVRAMAVQREAAQRAAYVAESATNLKDQLLRPAKKGGARLRALGTNVYVRYYGDETPSSTDEKVPEDPALELRAKQQQLKR
ncbi:MAG: hypothetical protein KIT34_13465 [Cyanobacteria bacterium TGS_CYA1]|nr:hypothetical protein [Cyanobacteria bacterium TGS_CYA1]